MTSLSQHGRAGALVAVILAALLAPAALGQDEAELAAPPPVPKRKTTELRLSPHVEYQFGGDDINSIFSAGTGFNYRLELTRDLALDLGGNYRYDQYDFESGSRLGDAWDSVHTLSLRARFDWRLDTDWTVFGGPIFLQAREDSIEWDIDFDENSLFGGFVGVSNRVDDTLLIGGGFAIIDQYQTRARFVPIFILDWAITSDLRLSTLTASSEEQQGIELIFDLDRNKQIAAGLGYRRSRFRLDGSGVAPDGVGEVKGLPMWGRFTIDLTPNASLTFRVGAVFDGNIELELGNGASTDTDRDTAGLIGVSGRIRF